MKRDADVLVEAMEEALKKILEYKIPPKDEKGWTVYKCRKDE